MTKRGLIEEIISNIGKVIIGKREVIEKVLIGMLCNGHILIEDTPGVGKTMLVKAISKSFGLDFKRVQFTPDLLPSDITGISIYNQKTREFEFRKGPIFTNLLLGDEINRTSPKTQAALLEAMEEKQVSEGGKTYELNEPFLVIATQNPIDNEGTYRLPEAQLDRFIMKISMGYPAHKYEVQVLKDYKEANPIEDIGMVCSKEKLIEMQEMVKKVKVKDEILDYIVRIVSNTRGDEAVVMGASTRAALYLMKIASANAFIEGRDYVITDDVKKHAFEVLSHRILISPSAKANGLTARKVIGKILDRTEVPKII
ncbi:AAA family ATPase [Oceanirhabdus sp. W0125-5]|uniref:AAA family ATPase n=1 Tax=Oceanirhabdus sp. W0125-5 TaxID=2999116 RepID=UPI0022F32E58|nr:MoxR family ATPase [Oceanirhabdus sp. W0125-5]WBW98794.1 MoxR family ATPase [Oceanirhabdus sp. W0125-5]